MRKTFFMTAASAITALLLSTAIFAQQGRVGGQQQSFPQPEAEKQVSATEIPGVIAAGARWKMAWQGTNNADGLIATADGGLLFAQEQPSQIGKLDKDDHYSIFIKDTHGAGSVSIDTKGRIVAVQRTCTDPGRPASLGPCTEPPMVSVLAPERKVLVDKFDGKPLNRPNDLVINKNGLIYFSAGAPYHIKSNGEVISLGSDIRSNGITLSPDDRTLYVTNNTVIVAIDLQPDGTPGKRRDFAKLEKGNGDGLAVDAAGRLYIATGEAGVQVFSPEGKQLGTIPTPRAVASLAFAGPDKKMLYIQGSGAFGPDGKEFRTPDGVRNNAKTIYKIPMLAQGFKGRPK